MSNVASDGAIAEDGNGEVASGGVSAAGNFVTQKMVPDGTYPHLGAAEVVVAGGGGSGVALPTIQMFGKTVSSTIPQAIHATLPCSAVILKNDDGASAGNGNADVIWVSHHGTFTLPNTQLDAEPIRPGESVTIPIDNANKLFVMSPSANQVLRCMSVGG